MSSKEFLDLIESSPTLTVLQARMAQIGYRIGEDFRNTIVSEQFPLLSTQEKVELIRGVYGEKILSYIFLSLAHTEYLATLEAKKYGKYKNIIIPKEPISKRVKNIIGASLTNILEHENYLHAGLTMRNGTEQAFMLPARTLAPQAMGFKEITRLLAQKNACEWCVEKAGKKYRIESKEAVHFHDLCRCIVKPIG